MTSIELTFDSARPLRDQGGDDSAAVRHGERPRAVNPSRGHHLHEIDDWALLRRAGADDQAFVELFTRHKDFAFRVAWGLLARRADAEDATQEVFLRLLDQRRRFRPRARFTTLLYSVTLNVCREIRRKGRLETTTEPTELTRLSERNESPAEQERSPALDPRLADLTIALEKLSERQRETVVLRHLEGLSTAEAARVMGCHPGTVKTQLHRGLETLRASLSNTSA